MPQTPPASACQFRAILDPITSAEEQIHAAALTLRHYWRDAHTVVFERATTWSTRLSLVHIQNAQGDTVATAQDVAALAEHDAYHPAHRAVRNLTYAYLDLKEIPTHRSPHLTENHSFQGPGPFHTAFTLPAAAPGEQEPQVAVYLLGNGQARVYYPHSPETGDHVRHELCVGESRVRIIGDAELGAQHVAITIDPTTTAVTINGTLVTL